MKKEVKPKEVKEIKPVEKVEAKKEIKKEVKKAANLGKHYSIIKYPLSTEKVVRLMESENKLLFVIDINSNKRQVKEAVEKLFNVKVLKVNTLIGPDGIKKAYVKLSPENVAADVMAQLGLM